MKILSNAFEEANNPLLEILGHDACQFAEIDTAGGHDLCGFLVGDQREQQMFERGVFVAPLARVGEGGVEGLFKIGSKAGHSGSTFLGIAAGDIGPG